MSSGSMHRPSNKRYEPHARIYHQAASVNGKVYMWGGARDIPNKYATTIEVFDVSIEEWNQTTTGGRPHPGVCSVACASCDKFLYAYGGLDSKERRGVLSKLDVEQLTWTKVCPEGTTSGPMKKWECGMVIYHGCKAALFGGYGVPGEDVQPGSQFFVDSDQSKRIGWTNEFHVIDTSVDQASWESPVLHGTRPPPCRNFTFTSLSDHLALFFGGFVPETKCRVNNLYLFDFNKMEVVKLEPQDSEIWPIGRACHAACCLGYGSDCPQLLVVGGGATNGEALRDAWLFDLKARKWKEIVLPESFTSRSFHTATVSSFVPGLEYVTLFGGENKFTTGVPLDLISSLADTTVMAFERHGSEWILMDIATKDQFGTCERLKKKITQISSVVKKDETEVSDGNEEKGLRDALRTSQAIVERERARRRVTELENQIIALRERDRESEIRIREAHEVQERLQQIADEELNLADERAIAAEKRSRALQQRAHEAERRAHQLEVQLHEAEQRAAAIELQLHEVEERVKRSERRTATQEQPHWLIQRREIAFTEEEIGRGGWAAVKVAIFRGARVAAKCFYPDILVSQYNHQLFNREMNMAARLRHPNLVQFIGASLEREPIILTEIMSTSLRAILEAGPITIANVASISLDIARGLNYLHLMQPDPVIHRDISSANVLLDPLQNDRWKAKITDYGSVNVLRQLQTIGPGSPVYAAPEASTPALQSPKMDIFSFGVLLVEMLTDQFPEVDDRQRLIGLVDHDGFSRLIRQCLSEKGDQRPSAGELIDHIQDIIEKQ